MIFPQKKKKKKKDDNKRVTGLPLFVTQNHTSSFLSIYYYITNCSCSIEQYEDILTFAMYPICIARINY